MYHVAWLQKIFSFSTYMYKNLLMTFIDVQYDLLNGFC